MRRRTQAFAFLFIVALFAATLVGCRPQAQTVVIYTSVDQVFSEPILERFEQETGITVMPVYDVEATKTTGLVNRLIAEKRAPLADVFWSGEFAQTIILQEEGVLEPYRSPNAADLPASFQDPQGTWSGFAGRARVFIVNTDLVPEARMPRSIHDLLSPTWPGERTAIAHPLFGTTATHAAALYATWGAEQSRTFFEQLLDHGVQVVDGNSVVRDLVAEGQLAFGLTDTDDACSAVDAGAPVAVVLPDQAAGELGTLIIPNTLALIKGGPHPENGKQLIDFLLSDEVAELLMTSGWSHVALGETSTTAACLDGVTIRGMEVNLAAVYEQMLPSKNDLTDLFVR